MKDFLVPVEILFLRMNGIDREVIHRRCPTIGSTRFQSSNLRISVPVLPNCTQPTNLVLRAIYVGLVVEEPPLDIWVGAWSFRKDYLQFYYFTREMESFIFCHHPLWPFTYFTHVPTTIFISPKLHSLQYSNGGALTERADMYSAFSRRKNMLAHTYIMFV